MVCVNCVGYTSLNVTLGPDMFQRGRPQPAAAPSVQCGYGDGTRETAGCSPGETLQL